MTQRMRADLLLVERGLFESRAKAQAAIAAGGVTANGVVVEKPSDTIAADAVVEAAPAHPYVSRGGVKLAAVLDRFGFDPRGLSCLDVGASTGGFTDVLLRRGARHVTAVDVGKGQLHPILRAHEQVTAIEECDIRHLRPPVDVEHPEFFDQFDVVVVDVSFISLKLVLPAALALTRPGAWLVALIKPQFEAGRSALKKGIVRDPAVQAKVCEEIGACVAALGWQVVGIMESPVTGGDGNREFLLGARRGGAEESADG